MNAAYINETIARQRIAEIERATRRPRATRARRGIRPRRLVLRFPWTHVTPEPASGPMTVATP